MTKKYAFFVFSYVYDVCNVALKNESCYHAVLEGLVIFLPTMATFKPYMKSQRKHFIAYKS